jgi:predicted permease
MNLRDLLLRARALVSPRRVEAELDEELAFHIERETRQQIADGANAADARARALARFGPVPLAADQCRDARGTGFVDGVGRDISYAIRTFRRAPLAALTIVATIALGLGLVAAVFTFYSYFFLHVDAVHNPGELFSVTRPTDNGSSLPFTGAEYEALRRDTSVFADAAAMVRSIETRLEARPASGTLVTANFFQMLGIQAAFGRTFTAGDDALSAGRPIVLSHRSWIKLFAADPAVIGRNLSVNGVPCEVVGVMPENFRGLAGGTPDYWAPLALAGEFHQAYSGREGDIPLNDVVGRLNPGLSAEQATAALRVWASRPAQLKTAGDRPPSIILRRPGGAANLIEGLALFSPIFFAFGLILMIGCANVANLLLARAISRQREIGIRLSLGASRRRIIRQLLTESLILALTSAACGFAVSRICLEGAIYAATTTMPPELAPMVDLGVPPADWRVLVFLLAGALVATVFFGLVPALQATRVELVRATRGEVTRNARPRRARHALIAVQVGASALLLICSAVFLRSAFAAAVAETGIRTSDTIRVPIANEPRRAAILRELAAHPAVVALAAVSSAAPAALFTDTAESPISVPIDYQYVSPEYFQLLDIALIRGRGFADAERSADAAVAVVSEGAARRLWPNGDAIGRIVRIHVDRPASQGRPSAPPPPSRPYTVVGVVSDVGGLAGRPMFQPFAFSGVYLPIDPQRPGTALMLRVTGDVEQARVAVLDRLTRVDPALDHEVGTMRTIAGMGAYIFQIAFWVTLALGALALALTVSGLFSVLSYLVAQRAKEVGVRIALGATTPDIVVLVLAQSVRPVGFGLLVGGGLAAGVAMVLLAITASEIARTVRVLDPMAYGASLLVIVIACVLGAAVPAWRAARVDPIATLRND